ncbi:MAG TPA: glycoside hydrolase family 6 protein [Polyangiaceae bacterium]|nr:glycoside hydrolase family 6 protein [Polyangiaceae bacterium]
MGFGRLEWCAVALGVLCAATACKKKDVGSGGETAVLRDFDIEVEGNPFEGVGIYLPDYTNADQARRRIQDEKPAEAALLSKIADTPQARWLGEWSGDVATAVKNTVNAARMRKEVPLFIAYNIPNRDCGQHSAGGAAEATTYQAWIEGLAGGIGSDWRAIVVLEPDALGHLTQCLDEQAQAGRLAMLRRAVETLEALPGVRVYIDAGHSRWVPAEQMAARLERAGIDVARGFALNTSNFIADDELIAYGNEIVARLGGRTHFIIDSSRNGNGAAPDNQWCNPPGRALGRRPTPVADGSALDAFAWLKSPGESDGSCNGGPPAGQWYHSMALELASNAKW